MSDPKTVAIAQALHELDRVRKAGALPHWEDLPEVFQNEAIGLVDQTMKGIPVEQQHEAWCFDQTLAGWTFGAEYDPVLKTDPRLVHWELYSDQQKADAYQAVQVIRTISSFMG